MLKDMFHGATQGVKLGLGAGLLYVSPWVVMGLFFMAPGIFDRGILAYGLVVLSMSLLVGVLPAALLGALSGALIVLVARAAPVSHPRFAFYRGLAVGVSLLALVHVLVWVVFPDPFASVGAYTFYLGVPGCIYLFLAGWLGQRSAVVDKPE